MIPKQAYKQLVLSMLALMIAMSISRFLHIRQFCHLCNKIPR